MADPITFALPPVPFGPAIGVPSALPFIVTGEESLRVVTYSESEVFRINVHWRMLTADRRSIQVFSETVVPETGVFVRTTRDFSLGPGLILNIGALVTGATVRYGQVYIRVSLVRGTGAAAAILGTLIADYLTDRLPVGWPGSPILHSPDAKNVFFRLSSGAGVPGAQLSNTVPNNARWQLVSWAATLTTDATVATRVARLVCDDGAPANRLAHSTIAFGLTAGLAWRVAWCQGMPIDTAISTVAPAVTGGWPIDLIIFGGSRLLTEVDNMQAGDAWGPAQLSLRQWVEDF